jgi:hypothetical protein
MRSQKKNTESNEHFKTNRHSLYLYMNLQAHSTSIAEIISDKVLIRELEDALQLLGDLYYQGFNHLILHAHHLSPAFFDLKTCLAGEILQKFVQYGMKITIIGDFSKYQSQSLKDFIYESNKGQQVRFLTSLQEALLP